MMPYSEFEALRQSPDSEERGQAAHLAALAYIGDNVSAAEQAGLYAALVQFLDDPSVKVRASLAYGLLHSPHAPRPVMLSLLRDSAIISRAVVQYSPVLIDADLIGLIGTFDEAMLLAAGQRETVSQRLAEALASHGNAQTRRQLLRRLDVQFGASLLHRIAVEQGEEAEVRGALLARPELPAQERLLLVQKAAESLRSARIVKGALAPERLESVLRNSADTAVSAIGEKEAAKPQAPYAAELVKAQRINARLLLHAVVSGHVLFFAACVGALARVSETKVFSLLETGSRAALNALFRRCGMTAPMSALFTRLVLHARAADLGDDLAARHYVVTALTEELIADHDGVIPEELESAFAYLSEQNISLARQAARGITVTAQQATIEQAPGAFRQEDRLLPAA
jgi:uncharacterized protein (DUF2336 family)